MIAAFTRHGGKLAEARAIYGDGVGPWLDLSTGINPVPWPGAGEIPHDWRALPDPAGLATLEAAAARHFGVAAQLCCAVPGSDIALRLLGTVLDLPGAYLAPGYSGHAAAFADGTPLAGFVARPKGSLALLLANPNNPDGRVRAPNLLLEWRDALAEREGWLVVDEAFADATPAISVARHVRADQRLIVLRSFGKFFGLAGLRLGFVLAPPPVIAAFRRLLGDWPVSAAALAIGTAAYADSGWIARARRALPRRAAALDAVLRACGLEPQGACPHFRLIDSERAGALFVRAARHGILTRPFDAAPRWLRLGVPADEADLARLHRALTDG